MNSIQLKELLNTALPIVKKAGAFMKEEQSKVTSDQIEDKARNSLVSYVDKQAEMILVEGLQKILPESTFITEEETVENEESAMTWIIDPLDGTTNFLHGLPHFAVSVGLRYQEQLVLGVVYNPVSEECFTATLGGGAYLNDQAINVSKTKLFANALFVTGFPFNDPVRTAKNLELVEELKGKSRGIRRFGSAALDLAFVAAGRFDAYFEGGLSAWDVAAGILLVEEAGGKISDYQGNKDALWGGEIIAATTDIHEKILASVQKTYYP